jgi:hypothetical protein
VGGWVVGWGGRGVVVVVGGGAGVSVRLRVHAYNFKVGRPGAFLCEKQALLGPEAR